MDNSLNISGLLQSYKMADVMKLSEEKLDSNTVETISTEIVTKHPLQNRWTMWFFKNDKGKDWAANLQRIHSFDTVEDFWALYNHIKKVSKISMGCDYSLFKDDVRPMWEDDANKVGGRWLVSFNKQHRNDLDSIWLETILCLIGEAFGDYGDHVCGATINLRPKEDKLGLWTKDYKNSSANMYVGKALKDRLNMGNKPSLSYQSHADSMSKTGSKTKNIYTI